MCDPTAFGDSWAGSNMQTTATVLKLCFSTPRDGKKTKCMEIMSMEPSTKIVKFIAPGLVAQTLGWGQYGHVVKMY